MENITIKEFLDQYWASLQRETDEATNDAVIMKLSELAKSWTTVIWAEDIIKDTNQRKQQEIDSDAQNAFADDYVKRKESAWLDVALAVWAPTAVWLWLYWKSKIYTQWKWVDVIKYIKSNLANMWNSVKADFLDKKALNFIDYLQNLSKEDISKILKEPLWKYRWLLDDLLAKSDIIIWERNKILSQNKNVKFWYEILDKLDSEIKSLWVWWKFWWKLDDLQEVYDEVKTLLDKNWWKISLEDVEIIKETAYENYDFTKSIKVSDARQINKWIANKFLWQWIKETIENKLWQWIKIRNEQYGKVKDMIKSLLPQSNKLEKMERFTTIKNLKTKYSKAVWSIPWISAMGNITDELNPAILQQEKLWDIINKVQKRGNKIKPLLDKSLPVVQKIINNPVVKKIWSKLPVIWWVMAWLWVLSEVEWLNLWESVQAEEMVDNTPAAVKAQTPKYLTSTISQWKAWLDPENKVFNLNKWTSPAEYLNPVIWVASLWLEWLSLAEKKIRQTKLDKENKKVKVPVKPLTTKQKEALKKIWWPKIWFRAWL